VLLGIGSFVPALLNRDHKWRILLIVLPVMAQLFWWPVFYLSADSMSFSDSGSLGANLFGWLLMMCPGIPLLLLQAVLTVAGLVMVFQRIYLVDRK